MNTFASHCEAEYDLHIARRLCTTKGWGYITQTKPASRYISIWIYGSCSRVSLALGWHVFL